MDFGGKFPILDGHNDTLEMLYLPDRDQNRSFFEHSDTGHVDWPRARAGGFAGGLFSIFIPSQTKMRVRPGEDLNGKKVSYALPLAASLDFDEAHKKTVSGAASLFRLEAESEGRLRVVTTVTQLVECMDREIMAAVLHFEGAEAIDTGLDALYVFHRAGLRSLGIAWSRNNAFAHGVPYRFPHSPDIGPGLTEAGRALVRACNRLGILIDVSHLNEQGFWDVQKLSDAPLVATHSGVHALCPSTRNLTDQQLDAIGASNGLVGINFHVAFLRADGRLDENTPIAEIVRHIAYAVDRIGIDHVGFGSDFDGAVMPHDLRDVSGLPKLMGELRKQGYDDTALRKLTHENWLRILRDTWKT